MIQFLDQTLEKEYTRFVLSFQDSWIYYSLKFRDLLQSYIDCSVHYVLSIDDNNGIEAVLPIMVLEGSLGKVVNSLPFYGSNGGILGASSSARQELLDYYNQFVSATGVVAATYNEHPFHRNVEKIKHTYVEHRIAQVTKLEPQDDLMSLFHQKTRNMIRKATKLGITARTDNLSFDFLVSTHEKNMAAIGGKAKAPLFFEKINQLFEPGQDYNIFVASMDGRDVAALLVLYFNRTAEYFTPVIEQEYRSTQALSLLIKYAMEEAQSRDMKFWNWGGTWPSQEGVYRFKKRWGATEQEYKYFTYVPEPALVVTKSKDFLLNEYPDFFVVPFSELQDSQNE